VGILALQGGEDVKQTGDQTNSFDFMLVASGTGLLKQQTRYAGGGYHIGIK
jgi:hypothetical protein